MSTIICATNLTIHICVLRGLCRKILLTVNFVFKLVFFFILFFKQNKKSGKHTKTETDEQTYSMCLSQIIVHSNK